MPTNAISLVKNSIADMYIRIPVYSIEFEHIEYNVVAYVIYDHICWMQCKQPDRQRVIVHCEHLLSTLSLTVQPTQPKPEHFKYF